MNKSKFNIQYNSIGIDIGYLKYWFIKIVFMMEGKKFRHEVSEIII